MSTKSYSRLWTHLIWETLDREPMLDKRAAAKASGFLNDYSLQKGIYMKINYFNADHTHTLIDLPTSYCIEDVIKLFKGGSSHWINEHHLIKVALRGKKDMERSQFHIQMLDVWLDTLPIRKSIIGSGRMRKSTSCL